MEHDLFYYLAYEVVLLVDDVRLVAPVEHIGQLYGIFRAYLLVAFEQLQRMPAVVDQVRIAFLELRDEQVYLVLDGVGIDHRKFRVVVVGVLGCVLMDMDEPVRCRVVLVVYRSVEKYVEAAALARRDWNDRNAEHLRQAVKVYLHPAFFDDVHHVEREHYRPPELQQLEREIEAAFQRRSVHDVDDYVHLAAHYELARNGLLHCVRGEAVRPRQVHKADVDVVILYRALHLFYSDSGPVRHL